MPCKNVAVAMALASLQLLLFTDIAVNEEAVGGFPGDGVVKGGASCIPEECFQSGFKPKIISLF